jgi:hypothetical protein
LAREQSLEQLFRLLQPFVSEHDGLGLVGRVVDPTLLLEPIRHGPIEALPGPALIMQRQPHQGENYLVDLVVIDFHMASLPRRGRRFRGLRRMLTANPLMGLTNPTEKGGSPQQSVTERIGKTSIVRGG